MVSLVCLFPALEPKVWCGPVCDNGANREVRLQELADGKVCKLWDCVDLLDYISYAAFRNLDSWPPLQKKIWCSVLVSPLS